VDNYIRKLPIAQAGIWRNKEVVLTNADLKKITKLNHEMLKAAIKTYEIPLIMTHDLSPDEALKQNKVFGYVDDLFYEELNGIGVVFADIKLLADYVKPFKEGLYRQFSWKKGLSSNRIYHIAVVGNQAIPIANIANAEFQLMSLDEDCEEFEYCSFDINEQEGNVKEEKNKKNFLQWLFSNKTVESIRKEMSDSVGEPTEELSEDVKTEVAETLDNKEPKEKTEELSNDKEDEKPTETSSGIDEKTETLNEEPKETMEEMSEKLTALSERFETLSAENVELKSKKDLTEIQSKLSKFIEAGKISPSCIDKLEKLYMNLNANEDFESLSMLGEFIENSQMLSFDDDNVVSLLKMGKNKEEDGSLYNSDELKKKALQYITVNKL